MEKAGFASPLWKLRAGRTPCFCHRVSARFVHMRLLSKVLWIIAFVLATFCWMVLFEHGFSLKGFTTGVRQEWGDLVSLVTGGGPK